MWVINGESLDKKYAINELQYVCKKLREETAGIEIKYNDITFVSTSAKTLGAMWGFQNFTQRCAPSKLSWLTRVILKEADYNRSMGVTTVYAWVSNHLLGLFKLLRFYA